MKKQTRITSLLLIFCMLISVLCVKNNSVHTNFFAKSDYQSSARAMIVMESSTNKVLFSKNENEKLPMASTTKIVTALTVLNNCDDIEKLVTIPKKATLVEGSSIYLRENEKLTIKQLLYGLMLQSGNDAALTLALEIGGSEQNFASLMNETAKKCGAENSNFVTPHGLDNKNHYTTASDLAKITIEALKNPIFKEIVSTKVFKIPATDFNTARTLVNKNKLLSNLEGCIGVKTGYTSKAGRCLVSACERNDMQVVCVVLNCRPMFEESLNLLNESFKQYKKFEILPRYKFACDVKVENGQTSFIRLYNKNGFSVVAKEDEAKKYEVKYIYENTINAPVEKNQILGKVEIYYDKTLIFTENLCSIEEVKTIAQEDKIKNILEKW